MNRSTVINKVTGHLGKTQRNPFFFVQVKKSCIATKELKRISGTYLDRDAFETKCTAGKWFDPDFPVCENSKSALFLNTHHVFNSFSLYKIIS